MKYLLTLALSAICSGACGQPVGDCYILGGQSNMEGAAPLAGEPAPSHPNQIWNLQHDGSSFIPAKDPLFAGMPGAQVGPGLWFLDGMAGYFGVPIGAAGTALGGTSMSQWAPDYTTYSLYWCLISRALSAEHLGWTIRGFVWYQGESDSINPQDVALYTTRMHAFFNAVRQDLNLPNLPIVFVQLGPDPKSAGFPYWSQIQAWQARIISATPPNMAMVTASDLHSLTGAQNNHLDQASQIILGGRIAAAMNQLLETQGY
jgi:Carbohydrate esterase, sialic acid-specific acetylesterase